MREIGTGEKVTWGESAVDGGGLAEVAKSYKLTTKTTVTPPQLQAGLHNGEHNAETVVVVAGGRPCGSRGKLGDLGDAELMAAKRMICGKEWCEPCGRIGSAAHTRRLAKQVPKIQQLSSMMAVTVTFPPEELPSLRTQAALDKKRKTILRILKNTGLPQFERTISRLHYFGEPRCPHCGSRLSARIKESSARSCRRCGGTYKLKEALPALWRPHFNVVCAGPGITRWEVAAVKERVQRASPGALVNFKVVYSPKLMAHKLRYILRATFLDPAWDPAMVKELAGYRNQRFTGSWKGPKVWEFETTTGADLQAALGMQAGRSPIEGSTKRIIWLDGDVPMVMLTIVRTLGAGFYLVQGKATDKTRFRRRMLLEEKGVTDDV